MATDLNQTTKRPDPADEFWGNMWWVVGEDGFGLRTATPDECAAEIKRLHEVINATFEAVVDTPDDAYRILKHSGVINDAQR